MPSKSNRTSDSNHRPAIASNGTSGKNGSNGLPPMPAGSARAAHGEESLPDVPFWDAENWRLLFRGVLLKEFVRVAPEQTRILEVFQEQGWRGLIDDPLLRDPEVDARERLRNTVRDLNKGQKLIHFFTRRDATAVGWREITISSRGKAKSRK